MIFFRYIIVQLLAYVIDVGLFLIVLQSGLLGLILANVLSKCAAGVFAFIAHRYFTFRIGEKPAMKTQAIRYFLLLAFNIPLSSVAILLFNLWFIEPIGSKFGADIVCVALTYIVSKHFVFSGKLGDSEQKKLTGADV